ncbi:hypothetical protein REPUB_Repub20aG0093200 [Reevesia pubescens]
MAHVPNSFSAETDILQRSRKKYKRNHPAAEDQLMETVDIQSNMQEDIVGTERTPFSYKDMLTGKAVVALDKWNDWIEDEGDDFIHFDGEVSGDEELPDSDSRWPNVSFSKQEKLNMRFPWRKALVVKLLGKILGFQTLNARIKNLWQLEGRYKVVDVGQDYFLFKFEKKEDYKHVLEGGHWIIGGHYLTVRQWTPNFDPLLDTISKIIAWIRFPGLPLEYYDTTALTKMGSHVGKVIRLDRNTEEALRGRFARVCIELDLTKPLISKIKLGKRLQNVEYGGIHLICFGCGKVGHRQDSCSVNAQGQPVVQESSPTLAAQTVNNDGEDATIYGPWMMIQRKTRPPSDRGGKGKGKIRLPENHGKMSNRFAVFGNGLNTTTFQEDKSTQTAGRILHGSMKPTSNFGGKFLFKDRVKHKSKEPMNHALSGHAGSSKKAQSGLSTGLKIVEPIEQFVFKAGPMSGPSRPLNTTSNVDSEDIIKSIPFKAVEPNFEAGKQPEEIRCKTGSEFSQIVAVGKSKSEDTRESLISLPTGPEQLPPPNPSSSPTVQLLQLVEGVGMEVDLSVSNAMVDDSSHVEQE